MASSIFFNNNNSENCLIIAFIKPKNNNDVCLSKMCPSHLVQNHVRRIANVQQNSQCRTLYLIYFGETCGEIITYYTEKHSFPPSPNSYI